MRGSTKYLMAIMAACIIITAGLNTASASGEDISDLKKLISVNEDIRMNAARSVDSFPMAISRDYAIHHSSSRSGTMKRSRQEIISQILEICINGASKTRIVYQANLNFKTVNPYLDLLIKNGLIQVNEGRAILYETTPKGIGLLESIKRIHDKLPDLT